MLSCDCAHLCSTLSTSVKIFPKDHLPSMSVEGKDSARTERQSRQRRGLVWEMGAPLPAEVQAIMWQCLKE